MTLPLLILRPEPGNTATGNAARALGIETVCAPLFAVQPVAWDAPDADSVDALLIGSANAIRHAGPALAGFAGMPAYAVGDTTARAARDAGLDVVHVGAGGLQGVLENVRHIRLLRLAGEERVALTLPPPVRMVERIVYVATPLPLPHAAARLMLAHALPGVAVALHSAAAAAHLAREVERLNLPRHRLHLVTLGPRISDAAGHGWAAVHTAATPDERSLLALAAQVCHTPAPLVGD